MKESFARSASAGHVVEHIGPAGDGDRDLIVADLDFPPGDRMIVGQDPDLFIDRGVEGNHRPSAHAKQLLHGQRSPAEHDRDFHIDRLNLTGQTRTPERRLICSFADDGLKPHIGLSMLDHALNPEPPQTKFQRQDGAPVGWAVSQGLVDYVPAVSAMEAHAAAIAEGRAGELVWLLEHPPLYTAGVSAKPGDLLAPDRFPVFQSGRGGQFTYHGPGQRVAYVMLDLTARRRDVRAFVAALEGWVIEALARFNVEGAVRPGRVGVWVERRTPGFAPEEDKIAAIGVKLRRWVSFHGIALNVEPDLSHFDGIVPCGVTAHGVTSLVDLGLPVTLDEADAALRAGFETWFGATAEATPPFPAATS